MMTAADHEAVTAATEDAEPRAELDAGQQPDVASTRGLDDGGADDAGIGAGQDQTSDPTIRPPRETVPASFEQTGEGAVDAVLDGLNVLPNQGPDEHIALYDAAHQRLHEILTDANAGEVDADARGSEIDDLDDGAG